MYRNMIKLGALLVAAIVLITSSQQSLLAQHTHVGDVRIDGSLGFGLDTPTTGSFGFDTMRMMENNLRIHFDDTSATASFPNNDWRIIANDSNNGGVNHISIEDATAGNRIFAIEAGARANSLYVESDGDIGIGTGNPLVDLHIRTGNTPSIRLEQDGSSGFTPQTWDIACNESNFFIRDATSGAKLPFRIRPNTETNTILMNPTGVGIGTSAPSETFHIQADGSPFSDAKILVENSSGADTLREMLCLRNNGAIRISMDNTASGDAWDTSNDGNGNYAISIAGTGGPELRIRPNGRTLIGPGGFSAFDLLPSGNLTIAGTLTESSDRNKKENFEPVDTEKILNQVVNLPLSTWNFKSDEDSIRHIGPMAQDFSKLFDLGQNDTTISPSDKIGVSMAAIQELHKQMKTKDDKINALESEVADMNERLQQLEAALQQMAQQK